MREPYAAVLATAADGRPSTGVSHSLTNSPCEFRYGSPGRLHRRLRYDREQGQGWSWQRLQP
ncbi:pyridoxine 5'-phosphate oxidase C-terminal domain-containing protein [Streptomyces sp. NPDC058086]|uniref:pyridoxine 5'-phosphate oxidase C-terminal domain-containing protein n=1 Tax=Streptomyces sp. NPDC058086 TaxID=3346334 RepID=UPI0036E5BC16